MVKDEFVPLNIHFPWAPACPTQSSTKSWRRLSDSRYGSLELNDLYGLCDNGGIAVTEAICGTEVYDLGFSRDVLA